ncbi:MAG: amidase domain-containing protein [Oscillospiraceae bacterium]|nr:amidase domain-containing protein [Oscillospiraceae bacterium]
MREYDRALAVDYARRWALSRNPAYYDFENLGGDCTNFASQCIYAGSGVMNYTPVYGWYYISPAERTASWSGVEYLYNFLTANRGAGPFGRQVPYYEARPGDIVQLGRRDGSFYHSPVITAVHPRILVAAHSYDALDRPLITYNFESVRFIHIEGVRY